MDTAQFVLAKLLCALKLGQKLLESFNIFILLDTSWKKSFKFFKQMVDSFKYQFFSKPINFYSLQKPVLFLF